MLQELLQLFALHRRTVLSIGVGLAFAVAVVLFTTLKGAAPAVPARGIEQELPAFGRFARATQALNEGREEEALHSSYALDEELAASFHESPAHKELYLFNLYRIAILEMRHGSREKELQAWDKLVTLSKNTGFLQSVREGELALSDWIDYRVGRENCSTNAFPP